MPPFERVQRFIHRNDAVPCTPVPLPSCPPVYSVQSVQSVQGVYPQSVYSPAVGLQIPSAYEGSGRLEKAFKQVSTLDAKSNQEQDLSTTLKAEQGFQLRAPKEIRLAHEKTDGGVKPVLYEKVAGKEIVSEMKIRYFADGKLYNEKGEVEGRFYLTSGMHSEQKSHPLFLVNGILLPQNGGPAKGYDWSLLSLENTPTIILNAPPPGLVPICKKVDCQAVEDSRNGNGPFKDGTKKDYYETEWVTPAAKAEHESSLQSGESIAKEIERGTKEGRVERDASGHWTLSDGTRVGKDGDSFYVLRGMVISTDTWGALAKTGTYTKELCPSRPETKPAPQPVPSPKAVNPPPLVLNPPTPAPQGVPAPPAVPSTVNPAPVPPTPEPEAVTPRPALPSTENRPLAPPMVANPLPVPAPTPKATNPLAPSNPTIPNPIPEPPTPAKSAPDPIPLAEPRKGEVAKNEDPRNLGLNEKDLFENYYSSSVRGHQQRSLQAGRASVQALRLLQQNPEIGVPDFILSVESKKASSPREIGEALERDIVVHLKELDHKTTVPGNEGKLVSGSRRLAKAIERVQGAAEQLKKMPNETSKADIDNVLRSLKDDFLALENRFAKDFRLKSYGETELMELTSGTELGVLIQYPLVPENFNLKEGRKRAMAFQDILRLAANRLKD